MVIAVSGPPTPCAVGPERSRPCKRREPQRREASLRRYSGSISGQCPVIIGLSRKEATGRPKRRLRSPSASP